MNQVNVYTLRFKEAGEPGVGNDVPYGRAPGSPGVGNDVPPQQTALQQTVRQNNVVGTGVETLGKPEGQLDYLVGEIEEATGDTHSRRMFRTIARTLPDQSSSKPWLRSSKDRASEIQGAVFVSAAKKRWETRKALEMIHYTLHGADGRHRRPGGLTRRVLQSMDVVIKHCLSRREVAKYGLYQADHRRQSDPRC